MQAPNIAGAMGTLQICGIKTVATKHAMTCCNAHVISRLSGILSFILYSIKLPLYCISISFGNVYPVSRDWIFIITTASYLIYISAIGNRFWMDFKRIIIATCNFCPPFFITGIYCKFIPRSISRWRTITLSYPRGINAAAARTFPSFFRCIRMIVVSIRCTCTGSCNCISSLNFICCFHKLPPI